MQENLLQLVLQAATLNRVIREGRTLQAEGQKMVNEAITPYTELHNNLYRLVDKMIDQATDPKAEHPATVVASFDDGTQYEFWSSSGGAHKKGSFGAITLAKRNGEGVVEEILEYELVKRHTDVVICKLG